MLIIQATLQRRPVMKCDVLSFIWRINCAELPLPFVSSRQSLPEGLSHSWTCTITLQVPSVEVLVLYRRMNGTENRVNCESRQTVSISTAKSNSAFTCTGYNIYIQAVVTEAALGSAHIAPEGNGCDPLQPALDPLHPVVHAVFSLRTYRSSCTSGKNSTSFWTWKKTGAKRAWWCWYWLALLSEGLEVMVKGFDACDVG